MLPMKLPEVCAISTSHLVSRRAACISCPSSINLPRECGLEGHKIFPPWSHFELRDMSCLDETKKLVL